MKKTFLITKMLIQYEMFSTRNMHISNILIVVSSQFEAFLRSDGFYFENTNSKWFLVLKKKNLLSPNLPFEEKSTFLGLGGDDYLIFQ